MFLKTRLLKQPVLSGVVISMLGLAACASVEQASDLSDLSSDSSQANPAKESPAQVESADSAKREQSDDKAKSKPSGFDYQRDRSAFLAIGPRPDRDPPLQDCGDLTTQIAMNECAQKNYQRVEDELDFIYRAWLDRLPEAEKSTIETSESAWTRFRDRTCAFERDQFAGGSLAPFIYNTCLTERTTTRTDELYAPQLAQNTYEYTDGILNADYQALTGVLSAARRSELTDAQLAWIEYRDRHCEFESRYAQVDIQVNQCKARLSEQRSRQLQNALEQNSL